MTSRAAFAVAILSLLSCGEARPPAPPSPSAPAVGPVQGWAALDGSPLSPGNARHDDLFFLDALNGWLINTRSEVYRTRDGGSSWDRLTRLVEGTVFLRCVGFASLDKGWAGNINATQGTIPPDSSLFETEDGGRTWANISTRIAGPPVVGLCGMRVLGPRTVVAVGRWNGPAVFVKTTDGGRTWSSRSLDSLASGLVDVFFFNEQDGFAVGGLGVSIAEADQRASRTVILATSDGGETWQTRYTSAAAGQWAWKIDFPSDRVGYVTTEGPSAEGVILKTDDGGATWRPIVVAPGAAFQGVGFVTPSMGWVASFPTLYATSDGGASWSSLRFGTRINRMRVLNDGLVYACGDRVYRWAR
jgi:photosystem II stability/assembly factor-like uncharacterized protein